MAEQTINAGTEAEGTVLDHLRQHFSTVAQREAERAARRLGVNGDAQRAALSHMADNIVDRLLRAPMMQLECRHDRRTDLAAAARKLFALAEDTPRP